MRVLLLALAASCSVVSLTAQQRAISDSDLFAFRWVASPQISPDGRQAAYVLVTVNAKHDGYETSLWLVNTDGASPPRRLTAGPRDGAPRWSPDGSTLAFVRPTDGRPQLYLLPLSGGEAQQLTDLPKGASPAAWSPDGKTIAFTSTTTAEDLAKKEKDKSEEAKSDVRIVTEAEFRPDGARPYLDGAGRHAGRRAGEGTPGDVRRVRRKRAAVEPRRDADLFRLGPRARVVLLPARQQLLLGAGGRRKRFPRYGRGHQRSRVRARCGARRQDGRLPRLGQPARGPFLQSVRPVRVAGRSSPKSHGRLRLRHGH